MRSWLLISLLLSSSVFSFSPAKCPLVERIKAVGLSSQVGHENHGTWRTIQTADYNTPEVWTFIISNIAAHDANDARNKANASLMSLNLLVGPFRDPLNQWWCLYSNDYGFSSRASTPIV